MSVGILFDILLNAAAKTCRGIHPRERLHLRQKLLHEVLLDVDLLIILFKAGQIRIENRSRTPAERIREVKIVVFQSTDKLVPREALQIFLQFSRIVPEFAAVEDFRRQRHEHAAKLFRNDAIFDVLRGIPPLYQLRKQLFVSTVKTVFVGWIAAFCLFSLLYLLSLQLHLLLLFI